MKKENLVFLCEIIDRYCTPRITKLIEQSKNDFEQDVLIRELEKIGRIQREIIKS